MARIAVHPVLHWHQLVDLNACGVQIRCGVCSVQCRCVKFFSVIHLSPIGGELSPEEVIHEVHLANDVDQVEELAEDELVDVEVVGAQVPHNVVHHHRPGVGGLEVKQLAG